MLKFLEFYCIYGLLQRIINNSQKKNVIKLGQQYLIWSIVLKTNKNIKDKERKNKDKLQTISTEIAQRISLPDWNTGFQWSHIISVTNIILIATSTNKSIKVKQKQQTQKRRKRAET